jgi:hypothetical protein
MANFSYNKPVASYSMPMNSLPLVTSLQQVSSLSQNDRVSIFAATLIQSKSIVIHDNGHFGELIPQVARHTHLIIPTNPLEKQIAIEAAQIFYSRNSFQIHIRIVKDLVSWIVHDVYQPSHYITNLIIIYGSSIEPGGNEELFPTLTMPSLQNVCLVFQDFEVKGLGPSRWLRPSAYVVLRLQQRLGDGLKVLLLSGSRQIESLNERKDEALDMETLSGLKDVKEYLKPATENEKWELSQIQEINRSYTGSSPMVSSILHQAGWQGTYDIERLSAKVNIEQWVKEGIEKFEEGDDDDIIMT